MRVAETVAFLEEAPVCLIQETLPEYVTREATFTPVTLCSRISPQEASCQPARSEGDCASAESCRDYEEQRFRVWYVWLGLLLFLVGVLLCAAVCCCLRCCLSGGRLRSTRRTLAVFALSDATSACESSASPWAAPKAHPPLPIPEGAPGLSSSSLVAEGSPPSYEEVVKGAAGGGHGLTPNFWRDVEERPSRHGMRTMQDAQIRLWSSLGRLQ
ncbi:hypothetical protein lerEdw1_005068 [Lerista edwardsae]|nr:hypothetical protein lerEdw1_005068 [Lerista edwardsae]